MDQRNLKGVWTGAARARALGATVLLLIAAHSPVAAEPPTATALTAAHLVSGDVRGQAAAQVASFKGVPFAEPPIGDLRWREAVPVKAWGGVRMADQAGPACIQPPSNPQEQTPVPTSEDCLYLNVWTGAASPTERRPVMVWIYGGGFIAGSNALPAYDGAALARKGVVVVTLNYRTGTLGFLSHPDLAKESPHGVSGNYALSDLVAGLKWVRANAAAFGGDPANVTIFGESAGSHLVSYLMASPAARGLFERAIGQSGTIFHPSGPEFPILRPRQEAEATGRAYAKELGADSIADLRRLPAETFARNQGSEGLPAPTALPSVDGYYLAADLHTTFGQGRQNDVPLLTGWNSQEGVTFPEIWRPLSEPEAFQGYAHIAGPGRTAFLKLYPAETKAQALRSAIIHAGDRSFGFANWSWAEHQVKSGHSKVFVYYFSRPTHSAWIAALAPELAPSEFGAAHGSENAYVFENLGLNDETSANNPGDVKVADLMSSYWVNFARNGDPNGPGLPVWPAYTGGAKAKVMRIDNAAAPIPTPGLERLELIKRIVGQARP